MARRAAQRSSFLPDTPERVPAQTASPVNARIEREIAHNVRRCAANPGLLSRRLRELDAEWDIERVLEANAATLAFVGVALGATTDRRLLWLPALVTGFLLQHALQGWCPPVPVLRRLGFRTAEEIGRERVALRALRGDFAGVPKTGSPAARAEAVLAAARAERDGPPREPARSRRPRPQKPANAEPASVH
jgi:hypothetical protein